MRVLLDTNIIIHRETNRVVKEDIGLLFHWLDKLHHQKCVHPITICEIEKHKDEALVKSFKIKVESYHVLQTIAPLNEVVSTTCSPLDKNENDQNDTLLINEVFSGRIDVLITEDKALLRKAELLGIGESVFSIENFVEKVTSENPALAEYNVLAVRKSLFGVTPIADSFFEGFKQDYPGFEQWFNKKSDEVAYTCHADGKLIAFLYLKPEGKDENYSDITPVFTRKKRLKIGTFKLELNGYKLGERFLKIIFDNALLLKVDEVYVTIFDHTLEHKRLIALLEGYGFSLFGHKGSGEPREQVYVRDFSRKADVANPKSTFPYFSSGSDSYLTPIHPEYHTNLFPDSILRTESPDDFVENEPRGNAIGKIFISRSIERGMKRGDKVVFYRTGGYYQSVITTIGIVDAVIVNIPNEAEFIKICGKRSVFSNEELIQQWNYKPSYRPFVVSFLYAYSLKKRLNLQNLIRLGIVASAPRGFEKISLEHFTTILKETESDETLIVD